ncbi:MAG: hypothetical protein VX185_10925 [Pseudomonadota bacterium]|nr:hypothetical protein [Pseudomonadota bacterium]
MNMPKKKHEEIQKQQAFLNSLLQDCLKYSFKESLDEWDQNASLEQHNVVTLAKSSFSSTGLITLSSYDFKMVMVLYFDMTKSLREFVVNINHDKAENIFNDSIINDYVMEMCNGLGGRLKRYLQATSYAFGMSTPNLVARNQFILSDIAEFDFNSHIKCDVTSSQASEPLHFGLSLFSMVNNIQRFEDRFKGVNFNRLQDDNAVGALEMF